jgi:glutamine---fructose-6-phosphate transaminase (isomerizing)
MAAAAASVTPGAFMFAEAAAAHQAVRAQLASKQFEKLGAKLRDLKPRAVATCARGSSDHAATFAKYLIETRAGVLTASAAPSIASLYRAETTLKDTLFLVISQSGASPDLIAAAETAKRAGAFVLALVNAENAPIAAAAHEVLPLRAGPEQSVAATKSFIASLAAITGLVAHWTEDAPLQRALAGAPDQLQQAWALDWSQAVTPLVNARSLYVIGRGLGLAAAAEAALKLKETCGLHAEAFSSAEMRHGPMALVEPGFPALLFAQDDETGAGVAALATDIAARGASVFIAGATAKGATALPALHADPAIAPLLYVQSFYRLAHATALARGRDPDRPPHLKKITETL